MSIAPRSNRFHRQERLLSSQDYKSVFAKPIKSADALYTVLAKPNYLSYARLGVIVSKKNVRTATARNRLNRIVRESFRTHKDIIKAYDVVVICKQHSDAAINQTLSTKLQKHWKFLSNYAE